MNIILHDLDGHLEFAPLTLTRPVGNLRMGIFTNDERWKNLVPHATISFQTEEYLSGKFPCNQTPDNFWINSAIIPDEALVYLLMDIQSGQALYVNNVFVAYRGSEFGRGAKVDKSLEQLVCIQKRWDLYLMNAAVLELDFEWIVRNRKGIKLDTSNQLFGSDERIFIEAGAKVQGAMLNTTTGPIYVGKDAEIMEGSLIRGGLALCEGAALKLGTKVYGATSVGPHCKVGGELNNVVFQGYSNKGHDGFLGNSVIGEWCNLGADTNCSNLKNNYGTVRAYSYKKGGMEETGQQFMGLMMGDHSKCAINTMFNTATVVGVSATVFGNGFPPKFIPNFSWSGFDAVKFDFQKAIEAANNMMVRRGKEISQEDKKIFAYLIAKV